MRERAWLTLEEAVRKMTSWPATRMARGPRRDSRRPWADVVIFDYETLPQDRATYEEPRLSPEGIDYVLVSRRVS